MWNTMIVAEELSYISGCQTLSANKYSKCYWANTKLDLYAGAICATSGKAVKNWFVTQKFWVDIKAGGYSSPFFCLPKRRMYVLYQAAIIWVLPVFFTREEWPRKAEFIFHLFIFIANFCLFCQKGNSSVLTALPLFCFSWSLLSPPIEESMFLSGPIWCQDYFA